MNTLLTELEVSTVKAPLYWKKVYQKGRSPRVNSGLALIKLIPLGETCYSEKKLPG